MILALTTSGRQVALDPAHVTGIVEIGDRTLEVSCGGSSYRIQASIAGFTARLKGLEILTIENVSIDLAQQIVRVSGSPVFLTRTEYIVIECLALAAGIPVGIEQLASALRDDGGAGTGVKVHIHFLRAKLAAGAPLVEIGHRRGFGYVLQANDGPKSH
jgi:DNA-binding response OmpR family regulator